MSNIPFPDKKYQVIYADPPWEQKAGQDLGGGYKVVNGKQIFNPVSSKSINLPYPTMPINDICSLPIINISEKNSFLFIWTTNKYLLDSKQVINAWGFKYVACIVWKKKPFGGGLGGTVRCTSEYLLFCRKGNLKATNKIKESVVDAKRPYVNGYPCHSKKPEIFASLIESVSLGYSKIELFARQKREGWDVWGNEV